MLNFLPIDHTLFSVYISLVLYATYLFAGQKWYILCDFREKYHQKSNFWYETQIQFFISRENQPKYDSYVLLMTDSDQNLSSHASYTKKEYSGPIPVSQDLFYDVIDPFRNILRILTFENAISSAKSKLFSKFALLLLFK